MDTRSEDAPVPNRLILVWFGGRFPVANLVALRSAIHCCAPDEVLLFQEGLEPLPDELAEMAEAGPLRVCPIDRALFADLPGDSELIWKLVRELKSPASRANLVRLAALWKYGGVYLDFDTVTVRDLGPLRHRGGAFCGKEHLCYPATLKQDGRKRDWLKAGVRDGLRFACAKLPRGDRLFRGLQGLYPQAVNNAVLGAPAGHPMLERCFQKIEAMSSERRQVRFAMGTHLLQEVTGNQSSPGVRVLEPEAFYPLGPEISIHWFRSGSADRLSQLLGRETYVVHWYASLESRLGHALDADWIRAHEGDRAFAALAAPYL